MASELPGPAYWGIELVVIFLADLGAGLLLYRMLDLGKAKREKVRLSKVVCDDLLTAATELKDWGARLRLDTDNNRRVATAAGEFGISGMLLDSTLWTFENSSFVRTAASALLTQVQRWELYRNDGQPVRMNATTIQQHIDAIHGRAEDLEQRIQEFRGPTRS
jgi:hypothetical protein